MDKKIKQLRRDILQSSFDAKACHIGSALSCLEIVWHIYNEQMEGNDVFLFSKASGAAALYTVLADKGYFPKEKLTEYLKNYPLASKEVPGVIHSVGSLGHGLSVACGLALGDRYRKVFVLLGDGECQEGSVYEAANFAKQHQLKNLFVYIDNNGLQALGQTLEMETVFTFLKETLPNCFVITTIKGEGVSFMQDKYEWHYKNLTKKELKLALKEND